VSSALTSPAACLQGRHVEVGRTEDWNAALNQVSDKELQRLGLSRAQLELTRYGQDRVQSVATSKPSADPPAR
jgi:hypothetical protein